MLTAAVLPLIFFIKITIVDSNPVDLNWSQIPLIILLKKTFEINWYLIFVIMFSVYSYLHLNSIWFLFLRKNKIAKRHANFKLIDTNEILLLFHFLILLFTIHPCIVNWIRKYFRTWKSAQRNNITADVLFSRLYFFGSINYMALQKQWFRILSLLPIRSIEKI
jgi:hypothetical protein